MNITQKTSKKPLLISAIVAALLLAGALSYYIFAMNGNLFGWQARPSTTTDTSVKPTNTVDYSPPTDEQQKAGTDTKKSNVDKNENEQKPSTSLTVSFTTVSQMDSTLRVRADIQELIASGTCKLTLKKGSSTVTKSAPTYAMPSTSTCKGFDIPVSELSPGAWTLELTVTSASASGKATSSTQIK